MAKKRHHYLPQFYLKGFIDPNNKPFIWVYEKGNPDVIRNDTAKNIAFQNHYYSFVNLEGNKDSETIENFLSHIEGLAAPVFKKIKNQCRLNEEEKVVFAHFLALTMSRVPNYRENAERVMADLLKKNFMASALNTEQFKASVKRFERETGDKIDIPIEEFQKYALDGEYGIKVNPQMSLRVIPLAAQFAPIFYKMNWTFFIATDDYKFVTSDNPLFGYDPTYDPWSLDDGGLLNENIEVTFPVSPDLAFLGTWKNIEAYVKANNEQVKVITRRTVASASRFVFSSQKTDGLNRLVQKY